MFDYIDVDVVLIVSNRESNPEPLVRLTTTVISVSTTRVVQQS